MSGLLRFAGCARAQQLAASAVLQALLAPGALPWVTGAVVGILLNQSTAARRTASRLLTVMPTRASGP